MSTDGSGARLRDERVSVKVKLALLWVALMFFYIYNDVLSFFRPGHLTDLLGGGLAGIEFTQGFLLGAAALMALPSIMILLSLVLPARANRLVNMILGASHILVLVGTQFVGGDSETWLFWRLFEVFELAFLALIIWTAAKWPRTS